jgi:stress response protein YsnF
MEEDVEITKRQRVKEEVEIEKVSRHDTERAEGTVRKERVDVTGDGKADVEPGTPRDY